MKLDRELIIQLAQETIFDFPNEDPFDFTLKTLQQRERFAEFVAKEERKRICEMLQDRQSKEERHNYYLFIANIIKESA